MTFVTKLSLQSGDRAVLEDTVSDLVATVERKGAECKGPHSSPAQTIRAPQYKRLQPGDKFSSWEYSVYTREMEIHGADEIAREVTTQEFPDSIHIEVEIERKKPLGHKRD